MSLKCLSIDFTCGPIENKSKSFPHKKPFPHIKAPLSRHCFPQTHSPLNHFNFSLTGFQLFSPILGTLDLPKCVNIFKCGDQKYSKCLIYTMTVMEYSRSVPILAQTTVLTLSLRTHGHSWQHQHIVES